MDVDSVKTNKTIRLAFAAAVAIIVTYSASTQWAWLTALAPMAAEASIDPLAAARYQEYAPRDFTGERAIAENALPWQHETWSGDNTPYQKARQEIDSAVAIGKSPMHLARQYEAQADKNRIGPLDQFRWGYALWRTITPTSTSAEKQTNKLGIFFALSKIASPNTYDYARLESMSKVSRSSERVAFAEPDQGAGEFQPRQVVGGLLLPADQDAPPPRQPGERALHHPTPGRVRLLARLVFLLLADAPDVRHIARSRHDGLGGGVVIAFVQAQMLRRGPGRGGPLDDDGIQRRLQQLRVGHVGPGDHEAKRAAAALDKQAPLDPLLGAVGRVLADALLGVTHPLLGGALCGGTAWPGILRRPLFSAPRALPKAQSADCQLQSTPRSASHLVSRTAHRMSKTPRLSQRCMVRWTLTSSPNSAGRWFHWQPVRAR